MGQKESLVQELLTHEGSLGDSFYGRIVLRNCNVTHYKRKQAAWQSGQQAAERKRELFRDIVTDDVTSNNVATDDVVSGDVISSDRTLNPSDTVASAWNGRGTAEKRSHKRLKRAKRRNDADTESGRDEETARVECVALTEGKKRRLQLFEANAEHWFILRIMYSYTGVFLFLIALL